MTNSSSSRMKEIIKLQFGNAFYPKVPGYTRVNRIYSSSRFLWTSDVQESPSPSASESKPADYGYASGKDNEFWIGVTPGEYEILLVSHDPSNAHGPFDVFLGGQCIINQWFIPAGEVGCKKIIGKPTDGAFKLRFKAAADKDFLINKLELKGTSGATLQPLFPDAPPDTLPEPASSDQAPDPAMTLRAICDWLIDHRSPGIFLGDMGYGEYRMWYTSAYPIRTLLAGYEIFGEQRYLRACEYLLDVFVDEQLPCGGWRQHMIGQSAQNMSAQEQEKILSTMWVNLSDIGSMAGTLGVACRYVSANRRQRYLKALRHFCEDWAMQFQQPSGGFSDGVEGGARQTVIYSAATGIEAATFAILYSLTGDSRYLSVAEKAVKFLLNDFKPDGSTISWEPIWTKTDPGREVLVSCTDFGYVFYHNEGLLYTYYQTPSEPLRKEIQDGWEKKYVPALLRALGTNVWWPLQDIWNNAKSAATPLVLLALAGAGNKEVLEPIKRLRCFLSIPDHNIRIGVMANEPVLPWGGRNSHHSWAGCSREVCGWAGMTLAEMIKPGVLYLSSKCL